MIIAERKNSSGEKFVMSKDEDRRTYNEILFDGLREARSHVNKEILFVRLLITSPGSSAPVSNFPSIIFFSAQDGVKIATRLFALNYLLQERQGEDYQERKDDLECHIESRESRILGGKVPLYISSFALTAVYFTERNSAKYNFYGKTVPVEISQTQRRRYK